MNKKFEFINSKSHLNVYYLILYPCVESLSQVIDDFNNENLVKFNGKIRSDLISLTGDRVGRFIEGSIENGKINKKSFKVSDKDYELVDLVNNIYMNLSEEELNKVYPLSLRSQLKLKKAL